MRALHKLYDAIVEVEEQRSDATQLEKRVASRLFGHSKGSKLHGFMDFR